MKVKIGKEEHEVEDVFTGGYLPLLELDDGTEWHVAQDSNEAGEAAQEYWKDMAENDPKEFAAMVGEETLISWALGRPAGPGSAKVRSLEEWLEVVADAPEEEFSGYDGTEVEGEVDKDLAEELGWADEEDWESWAEAVFYRHN